MDKNNVVKLRINFFIGIILGLTCYPFSPYIFISICVLKFYFKVKCFLKLYFSIYFYLLVIYVFIFSSLFWKN